MYDVLRFSRLILLFCICLVILANVVFSSRLVDSDDDAEPLEQVNTAPNAEQEAEINKLLLMKTLLGVRNRARAHASTTFGTQRASLDTRNPKIEATDLHTAYRLPLYRLSDTQLQLLLQKYDENSSEDVKQISRPEMITKLQELITKDEKMLRPRLLTNINVMNPNDLALHEPVVEASEIARTTVGPIETTQPSTYEVTKIELTDSETTRQAFLINSDNDDVETNLQAISTNFPIQPLETTETPIQSSETTESSPQSSETSSQPAELSSESTTQAHKQIPMDVESKLHEKNDEEFDQHMREKNNRLHSQYIASLSEDLQRLKAKYDLMKLEFLRTLRRINERNVNRANNPKIAAAPVFVVPSKESFETTVEDSKSGVPLPKLEFINDTFIDVNSTTIPTTIPTTVSIKVQENQANQTGQIEKPFGGERIEVELLANRESFKTTKISQIEEVDPSSVASESPDLDRSHQDIVNFFKNDEKLDEKNKTTISNSTIEPTITQTTIIDDGLEDKEFEVITESPLHENEMPTETRTKIIHELEKLIDEPTVQSSAIPTVELEKLSTSEIEIQATTTPTDSTNQSIIQSTQSIIQPTQTTQTTQTTQSNQLDIQITNLPEVGDKPLTVMEAMTKIESKIMAAESWSEASKETKTKLMEPKIQFKLKKVDELITASDLIDRLQEEAKDNKTEPVLTNCRRVSCDFEEGNLCQWKSSRDILNLPTRKYLVSNRRRRQTPYTTRGWQTWQGKFSNENSTIDKSDLFSPENKQFIATYLKPQQKAILTAQLPKTENQTIVIDFDVWEATRNMQLKFCCDTLKTCVFETEIGLKRGTRKWLNRQATCPVGTTRVLFECINQGSYQGACGIDNIKLADEKCPSSQTKKVYLLEGGEQEQ